MKVLYCIVRRFSVVLYFGFVQYCKADYVDVDSNFYSDVRSFGVLYCFLRRFTYVLYFKAVYLLKRQQKRTENIN